MTPAVYTIQPAANALRRIRNSEMNASGRIKKAAFMPRKEKDRDGLSVSIERSELRESHRAKFESEGHRACQVAVRAVRELSPLDVIPSPTQEDPAHALITGIPDRTRGPEELAAAEHFAEELAKRASRYDFPDCAEPGRDEGTRTT